MGFEVIAVGARVVLVGFVVGDELIDVGVRVVAVGLIDGFNVGF